MEPLPSKTFYPQARLSLAIRFEEFQAKDTPKPPTKPPQLRKGTGDPQLDVVSRTTRDGNDVLHLEAKGSTQIGPCATAKTSDDDRTHHVDGIIPLTAQHCRNGIRVADTLKCTIAFADFPFDPRLVRSCGVEFYFGTVKAEDFAAAVDGQLRMDGTQSLHMLPNEWVDARGRPRSNLRFQGWADDWNLEMTEDGAPVVSLECTDQTRLLIDQAAPPKLVIGDTKPLDQAIADYLANFPQFRGFAVQYRPTNASAPTLKTAFAVTAYKPEGMGPPAGGGGGKLAVWDYITDVCGAVGQMVFIESVVLTTGDAVPVVVIQRPMTLYGSRFTRRVDDPYVGRILPSGRDLSARTFTYGSNVLHLQMNRKFSKYEPTNIEVRSYDCRQKKTLVVRYPDAKDDRQKKLLPGNEAEQKWEVVKVQGIVDLPTLRTVAQGVYEQRMRCELGVHAHTADLCSLGGDNDDPDVLDMMAGDNVEIEVDRDRTGLNSIVSIEGFKADDAAGFLKALGYSNEIAAAYAKAASNLNFPTTFRVRAVTYEWKSDENPEVDIELVNYLEVKAEKQLPQGEEQDPDPLPETQPDLVTSDYI
jgi:hypothetical protein